MASPKIGCGSAKTQVNLASALTLHNPCAYLKNKNLLYDRQKIASSDAKPRAISSLLEYCRGAKEEDEVNLFGLCRASETKAAMSTLNAEKFLQKYNKKMEISGTPEP